MNSFKMNLCGLQVLQGTLFYQKKQNVSMNIRLYIFFVSCQRQKLREIILQQQQQKKNAIRQEKAPPEPTAATPTAPIQPWQQENLNQIFTRPPPPYPGNIRSSSIPPGGLRLAGFPVDGQLNRPQFPGDAVGMGMRPHGIRYRNTLSLFTKLDHL